MCVHQTSQAKPSPATMITSMTAIGSSLLLFYIHLLVGWGEKLLPAKLMAMLEENRGAQFIAGMFLALFTVEVFGKTRSITESFAYALGIFGLYVVVSKQSPAFFLATTALLMVAYFIQKKRDMLDDDAEDAADSDEMEREQTRLESMQRIVLTLAIGVAVVGVTIYFRKQYMDHGAGQSLPGFVARFLIEGSAQEYSEDQRVFSMAKKFDDILKQSA